MSTLDITAPAFAPRVPATRLRLTARGRRVLAALAALPAVLALAIAIVSGGGALASGEGGAPAGAFTQVTVVPGDTLWSIAQDAAPSADPRDVVDEIIRLNALSSGALVAGQTISLPVDIASR
ncbi:LysM peptidoglycan-binding domain-containing protein [Microbacterium flavum]|uniref:LysM peptidoglycan-binding domain-containing protein n=1 Tax=Microbacterium flavum TaxID=415216 RepID=UPI0024ACB6CE|nr:LysM peptidoglycan-binding domain-containing protein [Microbacterium flavum]